MFPAKQIHTHYLIMKYLRAICNSGRIKNVDKIRTKQLIIVI